MKRKNGTKFFDNKKIIAKTLAKKKGKFSLDCTRS